MQNRSHSPYVTVYHKICRMVLIPREWQQKVMTENESYSSRRITLNILVVGIQQFALWIGLNCGVSKISTSVLLITPSVFNADSFSTLKMDMFAKKELNKELPEI